MHEQGTHTHKARFAPSPTGYIHLGNTRTALFNYLYPLGHKGKFLLRIEDTDQERSKDKFTTALKNDLHWLGYHWHEGPDIGGEHSPYAQSQRLNTYQEYLNKLIKNNQAYPCFCSARELELSRKTLLAAGRPPRYAGTCAHLSEDEVQARIDAGIKQTMRFRVPRNKTIKFTDHVRGEQNFNSDDIGDFIIIRGNGAPAFFFTNAIDDALMGVTHVLRGEDHLTNTPRQMMILDALDLRTPSYGHISMILGSDNAPLSKRHGSLGVNELREQGYLPNAINNYLARLGHHFKNNAYLSLKDLANEFELDKLGRAPAHFDPEQLLHWQHEAVTHENDETLWQWIGEQISNRVPDDQRELFLTTLRPNITFPVDAEKWAKNLFNDDYQPSKEAESIMAQTDNDFFVQAATVIEQTGPVYAEFINAVKITTGAKGKNLFKPLRAALTGQLDGPELKHVVSLLGTEKCVQRLTSARVSD